MLKLLARAKEEPNGLPQLELRTLRPEPAAEAAGPKAYASTLKPSRFARPPIFRAAIQFFPPVICRMWEQEFRPPKHKIK